MLKFPAPAIDPDYNLVVSFLLFVSPLASFANMPLRGTVFHVQCSATLMAAYQARMYFDQLVQGALMKVLHVLLYDTPGGNPAFWDYRVLSSDGGTLEILVFVGSPFLCSPEQCESFAQALRFDLAQEIDADLRRDGVWCAIETHRELTVVPRDS
nr:E4 protein [Lemur mastadenovirus]